MSAPVQTPPQTAGAVVSRWVDAFNGRNLSGMLACLDPDVDFRPLRFPGIDTRYRGHEGARRWFAQLHALHVEHRLNVSEVRDAQDGHVLAVGAITLAGQAEITPVCALHRIADGLILAARHYYSDPDMLERIAPLGHNGATRGATRAR